MPNLIFKNLHSSLLNKAPSPRVDTSLPCTWLSQAFSRLDFAQGHGCSCRAASSNVLMQPEKQLGWKLQSFLNNNIANGDTIAKEKKLQWSARCKHWQVPCTSGALAGGNAWVLGLSSFSTDSLANHSLTLCWNILLTEKDQFALPGVLSSAYVSWVAGHSGWKGQRAVWATLGDLSPLEVLFCKCSVVSCAQDSLICGKISVGSSVSSLHTWFFLSFPVLPAWVRWLWLPW